MATATHLTTSLSEHDGKILHALFDAESSISLPFVATYTESLSLPTIPDEERFKRLRAVEQVAVRTVLPNRTTSSISINPPTTSKHFSTVKQIKAVISSLSAIINECPVYASAYLNRAQASCLLIEKSSQKRGSEQDEDMSFFTSKNFELISAVFFDLERAISLCAPSAKHEAISQYQRKVLAASHTHRGFLYMKAARAAAESDILILPVTPCESNVLYHLHGKSKDELEELASRDFSAGGSYGDEVARDMAVRTNPYAKMCGAIVKEAMRREILEAEQFFGGPTAD